MRKCTLPLVVAAFQVGFAMATAAATDVVIETRGAVEAGVARAGVKIFRNRSYRMPRIPAGLDGKLYIAYSNLGGWGGNFNSAELAVVPLTRKGAR